MDRRTLIGTLAAGTAGLALAGRPQAASVPAAAGFPPDFPPCPFEFGSGLPGLSKELLGEHLALYKGYVARTNALLKEVLGAEREGRATTSLQELRRRLGFEYSGLRLHELFFEGLSGGAPKPDPAHPLQRRVAATWGSLEAWWNAFKATCTMPGIGWGALVKDPVTGRLMNAWIQDHENAVAVGTVPLVVVDVWEHAYVKDYGATGRARYVDAIRPLIDWKAVERRF